MRGRRKGDTQAAKLARQEQVYRLILRGLTPKEVARQLNVTERTIQLDYQAIKANLSQAIQNEQLRSLNLALAELNELWREAWTLYHRPPREVQVRRGNEAILVKEDDRPIKLAALDRLTRITLEKNRLVFPGTQGASGPLSAIQPNPEDAVAVFINTLPTTLRNTIVEHVQQQVRVFEETP